MNNPLDVISVFKKGRNMLAVIFPGIHCERIFLAPSGNQFIHFVRSLLFTWRFINRLQIGDKFFLLFLSWIFLRVHDHVHGAEM